MRDIANRLWPANILLSLFLCPWYDYHKNYYLYTHPLFSRMNASQNYATAAKVITKQPWTILLWFAPMNDQHKNFSRIEQLNQNGWVKRRRGCQQHQTKTKNQPISVTEYIYHYPWPWTKAWCAVIDVVDVWKMKVLETESHHRFFDRKKNHRTVNYCYYYCINVIYILHQIRARQPEEK